jgi:hypothetical protein
VQPYGECQLSGTASAFGNGWRNSSIARRTSGRRGGPIVPCNDIDASTAFYVRPGLPCTATMGTTASGWLIHLSAESPEGWVVRGRNPNGLYLYLEDVDRLASRMTDLTAGVKPEHKPWGMYEFALSDPDGTLVRIGWPSRVSPEPREQTPRASA